MHITAHLDVDLVAVETEDEVSVLVELTAPGAPPAVRPHLTRTLEVVLDRSGSMQGERIDGAKAALLSLVDRLDPSDNFGLVAFDDYVQVTVAAGPLTDKPGAKKAIAALFAGNSTDLSSGYLRGIQEARRVAGPGGATVLLISDGHANVGVTDPTTLEGVGAEAHRQGLITSTLGWGLGYDELIMSAIARGGSGNELFAENSDQAVALIGGEVEGLLAQTAQAASVLIRPARPVKAVRVVNDLSVTATDQGILAELGSFYADETRKLILSFDVPAMAALGLAQIATLEFSYVELPSLTQHMIMVPLHVNVVPGDQAAGRVPDPTVRSELVYQRVQQAKRRASNHLSVGDAGAALAELHEAEQAVRQALSAEPPPAIAADLVEEARALAYLLNESERGSIARAAKFSSSDAAFKSHKRGRHRPSPPPEPEP
jgi:Ca-activated chloride channel family protein